MTIMESTTRSIKTLITPTLLIKFLNIPIL
jgi:hypothetical protein